MNVIQHVRYRMRNMPLRLQLVLIMCVLVLLALILTSAAGTTALRGYLMDRVDAQLAESLRAAMPRGMSDLSERGPRRGFSDDVLQSPAPTESYFSRVITVSGTTSDQIRLPDGSEQTPPALGETNDTFFAEHVGRPFTLPPVGEGKHWRVMADARAPSGVKIIVARTMTDVDSTVGRLWVINSVVGLLVLLLLAAIGYVSVRSSLRGLRTVETTAAKIASGDLSQRVPEYGEKTEIGRLARSLNTMLGQIETSFAKEQQATQEAVASQDRMRQFVTDASHELRTPLTSIRGYSELYRQGVPQTDEEKRTLVGRIESEAQRMTVLVEDLLLLARLDRARPFEREQVDIDALVRDICEGVQLVTTDHDVRAVHDSGDARIVMGDTNRLRQVVNNLVMNAITHTRPGTQVLVRVSSTASFVIIEVSDNGDGMKREQADHVFERFYRIDPSRTRESGGTGLGLSIVSGIVEAHGGSVSLETEEGEGSTFRVELPVV